VLRKRIANIGAVLQHVKAAVARFTELDCWGCLLRGVTNRISPVIALPALPQWLPATGSWPHSG
jgi:hypothetical protein